MSLTGITEGMSSPAPGLTCIGCGAERFQQFLQGPDRLQEIGGNYTLWRCPECGTFTLHPQPSPERNLDHYPADYIAYQPGQASGKLARCSSAYGAYKQVRFVLQRNPEPGWALDIGCGTGDFLAALRKHAWSVHGLEINPRIARYTHEQRGLDVIVGDSLAGAYASRSLWPLETRNRFHDLRARSEPQIVVAPERRRVQGRAVSSSPRRRR